MRALPVKRSEYLLEIVRFSYLPRLNNQSQRARRDCNILFQLECNALNGRIIENRNTSKFGNRFLEQLQPLAGEFSVKACNAGDVAAGTGQAFNMALLDRIEPTARHNDGNRLGRIPSRPDRSVPSYQDDINPETHQLSRKSREPIGLPLRISVLDGDVLSFYVAKLAQSCLKWLETDGLGGWVGRR